MDESVVTDPCGESILVARVRGVATAEQEDLMWAVNSPPLLALSEEVDRLDAVDLVDSMAREEDRSGKVGHYFEALIQVWLERIRGCEMVAHRQQVIEAGVTRGELDFVFRDEEGRLNHWETAVKFYLWDPENPVHGSCFIGPNTADTLERKVRKLMEHQLPLSARVYPDVEVRRALMKGRVYRNPFHAELKSPAVLNPKHLRGMWLRMGQLDWLYEMERDGPCEYRVLEKPHWLCATPFATVDVNNLRVRLADHFESEKKSIHVGISKNGVELTRLFVVADAWPHL